jgi:serine/threonine protein kinase
LLGEGSYAKVFCSIDMQLETKVAVKIFDKRQAVDKFKRKLIQKELDLMIKAEHPHIIQLYKVIEDRIRICFIMEYWGKQNLK